MPLRRQLLTKQKKIMEAKRLSFISKSDDCWEQLAEEYQNLDLDSFVARAKVIAPHIFYEEPETEEIEGEIQVENDNYILTWEDGMDECMYIYQKQNDSERNDL